MSSEHTSVPFSIVLAEELAAIRARRRCNQPGSETDHVEAPCQHAAPAEPADSIEQVRREALGEDIVGLAFSGGGIRSATFNLGILQGLADLRLLKHFDYLSTVSGGGYAGSWLAAWIKREGNAENVEKQLQSSRVKQAEAVRQGLKSGEIFDAEPEPIHHLRSYSNYLTPRLGLLSVDSWVLAAIYLRNMLLNLLVLVPMLLGLIMSERLVMMLFIMTTDNQYTGPWEIAAWVTGQATTVLMLILVFSWIHRSMQQIRGSYLRRGQSHDYHLERRYLHRYIMLPLLALGVLVTWLSHAQFEWLSGSASVSTHLLLPEISDWIPIQRIWLARLMGGFLMAVMVGAFHILVGFDPPLKGDDDRLVRTMLLRLARVALGLISGFVGGMVLYEVFLLLHSLNINGGHGPVLALTFGPPLFLAALILIAFIQVGLISRLWSESIREWWASLTGTAMIYLFAWLAIFGLSIWGPWLILVLDQKLRGIGAVLGAGWVTSIISGMMAGRSAVHGRSNWLKRIIVKVVPLIFLVGLVILTSFVTDYFVPIWGFATSPERYLQSVEQVGIPTVAGNASAGKVDLLVQMAATIVVLFGLTAFASRRINVNTFSLNALYQNRLARCYLGASRPKAWASDGSKLNRGAPTNLVNCSVRSPNPITGFDPNDDFPLSELRADSHQRASKRCEHLEQAIREIKACQSQVAQKAWHMRWFHRLQNWWMLKSLENRFAALSVENNYVGPIPILSTALNLVEGGELAWQERMAESFALTPVYCGSRTTGYVRTESYAGGISLAQAVAISGAAVSPNMGYHSYRPITALLTIFNMRLGAWLGNPRLSTWTKAGPDSLLRYLTNELFGLTNANQGFVYLSDGGHFENLGVYELIRRRCRYIVACDSGADPHFTYADLAGLIRKARIDFGIRIQLDTQQITPKAESGLSACHVAVGKIFYGDVDCVGENATAPPPLGELESERTQFHPECNEGLLVYIKPSITGDEPQDVLNYKASHPQFPHQPTTEQWFSESQFESYRALGWHIARLVFAPAVRELATERETDKHQLFRHLFEEWRPTSPGNVEPNRPPAEPASR